MDKPRLEAIDCFCQEINDNEHFIEYYNTISTDDPYENKNVFRQDQLKARLEWLIGTTTPTLYDAGNTPGEVDDEHKFISIKQIKESFSEILNGDKNG